MKMSGVINIEEVKNPIQVAEVLMQVDDRILGGSGATNFARKHGFEPFSTEIPQRKAEYEAKLASLGTGTVGCVALDNKEKLLLPLQPAEKDLKFQEESQIQPRLPEIMLTNFVE
jgi:L-asparaginase